MLLVFCVTTEVANDSPTGNYNGTEKPANPQANRFPWKSRLAFFEASGILKVTSFNVADGRTIQIRSQSQRI
jgi:hypothetical protein